MAFEVDKIGLTIQYQYSQTKPSLSEETTRASLPYIKNKWFKI